MTFSGESLVVNLIMYANCKIICINEEKLELKTSIYAHSPYDHSSCYHILHIEVELPVKGSLVR